MRIAGRQVAAPSADTFLTAYPAFASNMSLRAECWRSIGHASVPCVSCSAMAIN